MTQNSLQSYIVRTKAAVTLYLKLSIQGNPVPCVVGGDRLREREIKVPMVPRLSKVY